MEIIHIISIVINIKIICNQCKFLYISDFLNRVFYKIYSYFFISYFAKNNLQSLYFFTYIKIQDNKAFYMHMYIKMQKKFDKK